jgi:ribosomal protein S6--L-glutamate ligase
VKLYFILVRRVPPVPSPVLLEVFELLEERGFEVDAGIPEELVARPDLLRVEHDLYILKSHTELALSLAGALDTLGARLLNPYASCITTQDKIVAARRLSAAGVPAPRCWVTGDLTLLAPIAEETTLIVKPHRGHRGAGISIVRNPAELAAVEPASSPVLIQEYVEGSGEDVKVYVAGDEVYAVRKVFSPTSFTRPGRFSPVSPEVRELALACGRILGLGLYGLDVLETETGPVVVDVNYFPGYKGIPDVAPVIADYIEDYALGRRQLELPPLDLPAGVGA